MDGAGGRQYSCELGSRIRVKLVELVGKLYRYIRVVLCRVVSCRFVSPVKVKYFELWML